MRTRFLFFAILFLATLANADVPKLWGELEPGPFTPGFRVLERYDRARPFRFATTLTGAPRTGERARPMQISVWYPAQNGGARMTFSDYLGLVASQTKFGALTDAEKSFGEQQFYSFPEIRALTPEQRTAWKSMETLAVRDAKPVANRQFPLIVWSLHSPALSHVTPEYLASHGYVVVTLPRLGQTLGAPGDDLDANDFDMKLRDIDFLLTEMTTFAPADMTRIGAVGFSAGGRWMTALAMRNPDVRAVVSLDSVMLFNDGVGRAWAGMPFYDLERVRVPVLHMIRSEWVPREDRTIWERMRYADRTYLEFTDSALEHLDFQSSGYAAVVAGGRQEKARAVTQAFHDFNRLTRAFLDVHVKGDASARAVLDRDYANVKRTVTKAAAAPPLAAEFLQALQEEGVDSTIAVYRSLRDKSGVPPLTEATLNTVAYVLLLGQNRPADALRLFELNAESFPQSANVHDSLGDIYEALGQQERAIASSERALALLATDAASAERKEAIRVSAEDKLKRLRK